MVNGTFPIKTQLLPVPEKLHEEVREAKSTSTLGYIKDPVPEIGTSAPRPPRLYMISILLRHFNCLGDLNLVSVVIEAKLYTDITPPKNY